MMWYEVLVYCRATGHMGRNPWGREDVLMEVSQS
jgi:hypothetical protein